MLVLGELCSHRTGLCCLRHCVTYEKKQCLSLLVQGGPHQSLVVTLPQILARLVHGSGGFTVGWRTEHMPARGGGKYGNWRKHPKGTTADLSP